MFLVSLAALMRGGGCAPTRAFEEPSGPHFSLLTYNVNYGGPGADQTIDAIARAGADVVCLQETNPAWEEWLRAKLSQTYPHMAFLHSPAAGGLAVLSRAPIAEVERVPPSAGWFPAWILRVQTAAGPVQVVNVHLRPSLSEEGKVTLGALIGTKAVRLREAEALWPRLAPGEPTILAGDLNEGNDGGAIAWLADRGLTDALPEFDRHSPTWRWSTPLLTLHARFDHVLYNDRLHCLRAQVLNQGASDHFPVISVFQLAPTR
ncbi:MAG: endonuclease/exonuclease/phosphatase family protein [Planctomycetota bacterium]|nr:endonuclease/exonuclease/phosphatase family protein [Planctomycetota bacterium]